jgi:glucose/arabinose dehydrogenase
MLKGTIIVLTTALLASPQSPSVVDPNLAVRTVISGLDQPTTMAFLGSNDFLVLEKATGRVRRVINGSLQAAPVLDLPVNSGSERGLLGIALHPQFTSNRWVYLYWTESSIGADSTILAETPLLGNRVDRFTWNGTTLSQGPNIIMLRALQPAFDREPVPALGRGNHDGGPIAFGPDGKLYLFIGDVGRRGWLQNLRCGPTDRYDCPPGTPVQDDSFGGPQPDNAHLTGVVLRLNDNGSTPTDNPFFAVGAGMPGVVGANIQKVYSYGHRNSFGMAFDPHSRGLGNLWLQENGDDTFSELTRVEPGMNGGWIQVMGPVARLSQFKGVETSPGNDPCLSTPYFGLQQTRWLPTLIANSPAEALSRLFMLPGAHYKDPEFSWKFEVSPAGIGFLNSRALGPQYEGDLFMGAARTFLQGGHLFRLQLTGNRRTIGVDDSRLADRVADNTCKFDITESESLLFGRNFGVGTDVRTGPNGNLFIVSLSNGAVYEIYRKTPSVP